MEELLKELQRINAKLDASINLSIKAKEALEGIDYEFIMKSLNK
jgi:hypothetical protein